MLLLISCYVAPLQNTVKVVHLIFFIKQSNHSPPHCMITIYFTILKQKQGNIGWILTTLIETTSQLPKTVQHKYFFLHFYSKIVLFNLIRYYACYMLYHTSIITVILYSCTYHINYRILDCLSRPVCMIYLKSLI